MKTITFNTAGDFKLVYEVNNSNTASNWLDIISRCTTEKMLYQHENYLHGFASPETYDTNCRKLLSLIHHLGINTGLDLSSSVLNNIHAHFVTGSRDSKYMHLTKDQMMQVNLLIHWIEYEQANNIHNRGQYIINLDFNHHSRAFADYKPIHVDELQNFSAAMEFGSLHLHYSHIGRHFLEMFDARDMVSPRWHYVPHTSHNATCGLVFSEPQDNTLRAQEMLAYFDSRGGEKFWGCKFTDRRMSVGFFQLGRLLNHHTQDPAVRQYIRQQVCSHPIVSWHTSNQSPN